jgi:hypothetical protein
MRRQEKPPSCQGVLLHVCVRYRYFIGICALVIGLCSICINALIIGILYPLVQDDIAVAFVTDTYDMDGQVHDLFTPQLCICVAFHI